MTLQEVSIMVALATALGGALGAVVYWFATHRTREVNASVRAQGLGENNALLKEQNVLLRDSLDAERFEVKRLRELGDLRERRINEIEKTAKILDERVTQRAAVEELAGALAVFSSRHMDAQSILMREIAEVRRQTAEWQAHEAKERADGRKVSAQEHQHLAEVLERIAKVLPRMAA